ncbi:cupin domain-containing protein [Bailinhaonella thermotolerans]|uniref:Cupin domain-containing protein n=1 Tax=Bailinhaonella thermotolerans TaxID=1070861 RepID=A0A3A4AKX6_9ACTN|nr:cupin domain-containing protein [Bailinhaonella thermotolerans]RJL19501.1 cupin domain-containing protein [Bailinhaonella thermotolerans]
MSYPEPRYLGESGEVSAVYRPAGSPPELTYPNGNTVEYLATGESTNGQFGLYKWNMGPEPSGPGPHFHRTLSESFFILSGTVKIYNGEKWLDTTPGDWVHVPEGGIHGFRNESGEPATMLLHFSPGAPREGYFEGLLDFAVNGRPSDEEVQEFYRYHDNYWL